MTIIQSATLAIAVLGAVLGVINTLHTLNKSRAKLRVRFVNFYAASTMEHLGYCIEVTNLSTFPLTVQETGFSLSPFWVRDIERVMVSPFPNIGNSLPCRIESRQQVNFRFSADMRGITVKKIRSAYVKTDCGLYFRGVSPALVEATKRFQL